MNKRINRTAKYLIVIGVLIVVFNTVLGVVLTTRSARALKEVIKERMVGISNTAAAMLDGDVLGRLQAEDKGTPEYQHVYDTLDYFLNNTDLEFIYCIRDMGDKNFVFVIDTDPLLPGQFGDPVVYTDALYQASLATTSVDEVPYEDEWGRFYSSYSPVFDSEGKVAGIVAVDFSAAWYEEEVGKLTAITIIIIAIAVIFSSVLIIIVTTRYDKHYAQLRMEVDTLSDSIESLVREVAPGTTRDDVDASANKQTGSNNEIIEISDEVHSLQTRLSGQLSVIRSRAYIDELTGTSNRAAYIDRLKHINDQIRLGRACFSVLVFDINRLKSINDDFGHEVGDRVIAKAAEAIKSAFPKGTVYRVGGDEFVAILDMIASGDCAARFKAALADMNAHSVPVELEISVGYAYYDSGSDPNYKSVFNRADAAMYEDKREFYRTHVDRRKRL